MKKLFLGVIINITLCGLAFGQSSPGLIYGQVPTAGQWNSYFAAKQDVLGFTPLNINGGIMTGKLITAGSNTTQAGFNLPAGSAPTTPVNGDLWTTTSGLFAQINGGTVGPYIASGSIPAGGTNGQIQYNNSGVLAGFTLGGDCTFSNPNITCTKVNGVSFPSSGTSGGIPYYSSTSAISSSAALTANQIVIGGGPAVAPTTFSCPTGTTIIHGGTPPTCGQLVNGDITTNTIANASLAQAGAATLKGNTTSGTANVADFTIQGLTNLASPSNTLDFLVIYDHAAGTLKSVTPSAIAGSVGAVTSVSNSDGSLTISPTTGAVVASIANPVTVAIADNAASPQITLGVNTSVSGGIKLFGSTSGNTTIKPSAIAGTNTVITLPGVTDTVVVLGTASQVVAGGAVVTPLSQSAGNITINHGARPLQYQVNTGAFTITAPAATTAADGSSVLFVQNGPSAGAITFSGWSVGSNTGDTFATTLKHTQSCTATSASPAVFTDTGHGLLNSWPVYLTGTTAPTGFTLNTQYYTNAVATNTYQLSATPGGTSINSSSTGTSITCNADSVYALQMETGAGLSTYSWKALQ